MHIVPATLNQRTDQRLANVQKADLGELIYLHPLEVKIRCGACQLLIFRSAPFCKAIIAYIGAAA